MAQAKKKSTLKRLATGVNLLMLLLLPLLLHGLIYVERHPQEAPLLWNMKTELETYLLGLPSVNMMTIRPYYVAVLILAVMVIYVLKLIGTLAIPSWRSFSRIGALSLGLIILLTPMTLSHAGVCAYEFRRASKDDILARALMMGMKNGDLDPGITSVDDYFRQHNRRSCCRVVPRKRNFTSVLDVFDEISIGRIYDVVYEGDSRQLRASVEMCRRSAPPQPSR